MRGQFKFWLPEHGDPDAKRELIIPNTVVNTGENAFLQMLMQGNNTIVAANSNFYIGLCGLNLNAQGVLDKTVTLATLAGEPTNAGGYARQAVQRSTSGFPVLTQINGIWKATSAVVNFTASGANFSTLVYRAFVCSVVSGAGTLFAVSAQLPTPQLIANGQTFPVQYEFYLN